MVKRWTVMNEFEFLNIATHFYNNTFKDLVKTRVFISWYRILILDQCKSKQAVKLWKSRTACRGPQGGIWTKQPTTLCLISFSNSKGVSCDRGTTGHDSFTLSDCPVALSPKAPSRCSRVRWEEKAAAAGGKLLFTGVQGEEQLPLRDLGNTGSRRYAAH